MNSLSISSFVTIAVSGGLCRLVTRALPVFVSMHIAVASDVDVQSDGNPANKSVASVFVPKLTRLALSGVTLKPAFSSSRKNYSVSVPDTMRSIKVTPTATYNYENRLWTDLSGRTLEARFVRVELKSAILRLSGNGRLITIDMAKLSAADREYINLVLHAPAITIRVNGIAVDSGKASPGVPLKVGKNTILVVVKSKAGASTKYEITVTRASKAAALLAL